MKLFALSENLYIGNINRVHFISNNIIKKIFLILLFCVFLSPFSISVGTDGVSANYLFVLFPISVALILYTVRLPSDFILFAMALYVSIFLLGAAYQFSFYEFFGRRLASFIIFMSMFSFMFIKIDNDMVKSFKFAIILISILFSAKSIFMYFILGGSELGFAAKGAVGSQRYGFVYVLAIWILWLYIPSNKYITTLKYLGLLIIGAGLLLTFSRSGIVAITGSFTIYTGYKVYIWLKKPIWKTNKSIINIVIVVLFVLFFYLILNKYFSLTLEFYADRLFSLKQGSGVNTYQLDNPMSSEGYRIAIFYKVMDYVSQNFITGSGYLGIWILSNDFSGSSHNQYLDVLFRTGVVGFLIYIYILFRLLKYLILYDPGLFWGTIGILIYGLVHETFKLSQGLFILAFMLGMMERAKYKKLVTYYCSS